MSINICFNDCAVSVLNGRVHLPSYECEPILMISLESRHQILEYRDENIWLSVRNCVIDDDRFNHEEIILVLVVYYKKISFRIYCQIKNCRTKSRCITLFLFAILVLTTCLKIFFFSFTCSRFWDMFVNFKKIVIDWLTTSFRRITKFAEIATAEYRNDCYTIMSRVSMKNSM